MKNKLMTLALVAVCAALPACCTTRTVYNTDTKQPEEVKDCLNPLEMAFIAISVPWILITDPFN